MKKVNAYEFKDLPRDIRTKVKDKMINGYIEQEINFLAEDVREGRMSESEMWDAIGCSKHYGETTPWFVPSVYYENHTDEVESEVKEILEANLYDKYGDLIYL